MCINVINIKGKPLYNVHFEMVTIDVERRIESDNFIISALGNDAMDTKASQQLLAPRSPLMHLR